MSSDVSPLVDVTRQEGWEKSLFLLRRLESFKDNFSFLKAWESSM